MIPELFRIGPLAITPFGLMMVVGFVGAWWQLQWGFRRLGVGDEEDASAVLLAAGIGGILGAKLYYAALYADWRLVFDRSGLVWYGGFALGAAAVIWMIRRRGLPAWAAADAAAPAVALGYGLGRIGCFLVGDDYGRPTGLPWGVAFPHGLPGPTTAGTLRREFGVELPPDVADGSLVAVHPTQLYEAVLCLAIFAFGRRLIARGALPGSVTLTVIALLAVERFAVEFVRLKDDRMLGSLTLAQAISAAALLIVLALWLARRRVAAGDEGSGE